MKPLHVLLPTDVFPPRTGGAGWSSHALALALLERGHQVTALVPKAGMRGLHRRVEAGVPVVEVGYQPARLPFVANWSRFELFWPQFAQAIVQTIGKQRDKVIIHGQHVQGIGAAVLAGQQLNIPVVATVRDHWPNHYFGTNLHGDQLPLEDFGWAAAATDLVARRKPWLGVLSLLALPYVQAHMQRRRQLLQACDAVISLSNYITQRLSTVVAAEKLWPIPNLVNLAAISKVLATPTKTTINQPYILFTGKLARNKGAYLLPEIMASFRAAGGLATLVIAGGKNPELVAEIQAQGVEVLALDWVEHDEVLRLMAGAKLLLFPSTWGEPLSRVLLEACAVGMPIVAMATGGTPDLIQHGQNGYLARSAKQLGVLAAALLHNPQRAEQLGRAAYQTAQTRLATTIVAEQVEQLYWALLTQQPQRALTGYD
ncbi:MAG: glycosyltransferase family 4 protein [Chloroflexi bacterium]|nr:glycosyltransferase family 4 protein [Chloroflexota bacterium]